MITTHYFDELKERAQKLNRHIVYPDAADERAIRAARIVTDERIASITLIGDEQAIRRKAEDIGVSIQGVRVVDPDTSSRLSDFTNTYFNLRKHKGMTIDQARESMRHPLYFGAMMVREGTADGSIAGSLSTTGDVIRAAITTIGLKDGIRTVSSFFMMAFPEVIYFFADGAVMPDPTATQLADIAIATADNYKTLMMEDAKVALLSFSTKGSAEHDLVTKVREALAIVKERRPDIRIDGELQLDAAVVQSIGERKAPGSSVAGKANVLIFPDLNAGNIGYKLAERLGGAKAIGPIVQGLAKPAYDLSRGCSVEDIVTVTTVNALMGAV